MAYEEIKKDLAGRRVLTSYSESSDLHLATDASEYGLGAVLFLKDLANFGKYGTRFDKPEERVISYASRTLSAAERNNSPYEKEALGIIFGLKKFEKYLMGLSSCPFQVGTFIICGAMYLFVHCAHFIALSMSFHYIIILFILLVI